MFEGSRNTEKESYFFCKRGRKYRNSIRPNRVTGSGFWKATGIDKPIYSDGSNKAVIGLKKTLVYYLGSAGKGSKTDWMMHEFRLPTANDTIPGGPTHSNPTPTSLLHAVSLLSLDCHDHVWFGHYKLFWVWERTLIVGSYYMVAGSMDVMSDIQEKCV